MHNPGPTVRQVVTRLAVYFTTQHGNRQLQALHVDQVPEGSRRTALHEIVV